MERKKSKHSLLFPTTFDMGRFLGHKTGTPPREGGSQTYELRGVLLHKGPSAYHGHYEAQVFDTAYAKSFSKASIQRLKRIITIDQSRGFNSTTKL